MTLSTVIHIEGVNWWPDEGLAYLRPQVLELVCKVFNLFIISSVSFWEPLTAKLSIPPKLSFVYWAGAWWMVCESEVIDSFYLGVIGKPLAN